MATSTPLRPFSKTSQHPEKVSEAQESVTTVANDAGRRLPTCEALALPAQKAIGQVQDPVTKRFPSATNLGHSAALRT